MKELAKRALENANNGCDPLRRTIQRAIEQDQKNENSDLNPSEVRELVVMVFKCVDTGKLVG